MSILGRFKVKKALGVLRTVTDTGQPQYAQTIMQLKLLGRSEMPQLLDALSEDALTEPLVDVLAALLDDTSLPTYIDRLSHPQRRVVDGVARVLTDSHRYDPNQLLPLFTQTRVPKGLLAQILLAHKAELQPQALWSLVDSVTAESRTAVFHLLGQVATLTMLPDLLQRTWGEDALVRMHMAHILGNLRTEAVYESLVRLAHDHDKNVRVAALEGLAKLPPPFAAGVLCPFLRDPDVRIQGKVVAAVVQSHDPKILHPLLDILQDDSEYVRRAALEVLHAVSHTDAIKDLLAALRDEDWWVRVRAADVLGHVGGPKIVEAVLPLVKDQDEFIRRCAIEILNTAQDERALQYLLATLENPDWWVRERAIDALVQLGSALAIPALLRLIATDPGVTPAAIRTIATLGDAQFIPPLLEKLPHAEKMLCQEVLHALETLTDTPHAAAVQRIVFLTLQHSDAETRQLAQQVLQALMQKFGDKRPRLTSTAARRATMPTRSEVEREARSASGRASRPTPASPTIVEMSSVSWGRQWLDAKALQPGVVLAERYRIIRQIGEGGFGVVMLVNDMAINEDIALKFLNPSLAAEGDILKRFIHELRYTRRLTHKNIIRIYDFVTFDNAFAISMEYFPSHALDVELQHRQPANRTRALQIVRDMCRGLQVAHSAGIVHRDLKPQNVLVNDHDLVKIVDFGLAVALLSSSSRLTGNDALLGTPTYMAPEQILPKGQVDIRTDIYSLGVMMYEMFTGKPPYHGQPMEVMIQHTRGNVVAPRHVVADFPAALEAIILKAMAVTPNRRFQSVVALEESLAAFCAQEG